jgi:hypothetical protein
VSSETYLIDISNEPVIGPGSIISEMYLCSRCGALIVRRVGSLDVYKLHSEWHQRLESHTP